MEFKLTSPAFAYGKQIPSRHTCDGENINPHLVIYGAPEKAKSLALIMDDPDAPEGVLVHWVAWDIPPDAREIREHSVPFGTRVGCNVWGNSSYDDPCPIAGTHRYFFRLYALDTKPELPEDAGREELESAMQGHIIATTELMGTYMRTNEAPL